MSLDWRRATTFVAAVLLTAACAGGVATPAAACADTRSPGADAELEALLPRELDGRAPETVDSGRFCSAEALGSLIPAGIAEVRFAGATWPEDDRGVSLVLYRAPNLDLDRMADAFATGAGVARRITNVTAHETTFAGGRAIRVNAVATDRALNVLLWSPRPPDLVAAALASGVGEQRLLAAAQALEETAGQ